MHIYVRLNNKYSLIPAGGDRWCG